MFRTLLDGLPWWLSGKESGCQCRRGGFDPWVREDSPGGGNDKPLQYSCPENPMDREAWRARVHGVKKESDTTEQLNNIMGLKKPGKEAYLLGVIVVWLVWFCRPWWLRSKVLERRAVRAAKRWCREESPWFAEWWSSRRERVGFIWRVLTRWQNQAVGVGLGWWLAFSTSQKEGHHGWFLK